MDWYYIFPMPDPRDYGIDYEFFRDNWRYLIIMIAAIWFLFYSLFYFRTLPEPKSIRRFWTFYGIILLIGSILMALVFIYLLVGFSPEIWKILEIIFITFVASFEMSIGLYLIFAVLYILIFAPLKLNIKAMRRYPFKFIK